MALLRRAEDVAEELVARVATCRTANGAETNLGAAVYQGRRHIDDEMIPCSVVIEGEDAVDSDMVGTGANLEQSYVVLAYLPCDPANPNSAAHKGLRDLKRAVFTSDGKADRFWRRTVGGVRYRGRSFAPRADGAPFVLVALEVSVRYSEDLASP